MTEVRKVMTITDQIDRALTHIYNAALKHEGLALLNSVNAVKNAVIEEKMAVESTQRGSHEEKTDCDQ